MGIGPFRPGELRVASLLVALGMLSLLSPPAKGEAGFAVPTGERRAEILKMVRQDCGSCHGMTMKGGLGPALTPAAVQSKPADSLAATILQGRPGTAMPPWRDFLSADEAAWIVEQLQQGLPDVR
jgi:cytochrome c55X